MDEEKGYSVRTRRSVVDEVERNRMGILCWTSRWLDNDCVLRKTGVDAFFDLAPIILVQPVRCNGPCYTGWRPVSKFGLRELFFDKACERELGFSLFQEVVVHLDMKGLDAFAKACRIIQIYLWAHFSGKL